jgi:hypothetical protein
MSEPYMAALSTALDRHGIFVRPNGAGEVKAVRAFLLRGTCCGQRTDLDDEFDERHEPMANSPATISDIRCPRCTREETIPHTQRSPRGPRVHLGR